MREVDRLIKEGYTYVVDADLQSYFDTIPHDQLMARVEEKVSDGRVLDLIRGWLTADILKGLERWRPTQGSPQGAVISPLLANIYLDPLDRLMAERGYRVAAKRASGTTCGDQPAAGQHLSGPIGSADARARIPHGAVCRRLRDPVPDSRGG